MGVFKISEIMNALEKLPDHYQTFGVVHDVTVTFDTLILHISGERRLVFHKLGDGGYWTCETGDWKKRAI